MEIKFRHTERECVKRQLAQIVETNKAAPSDDHVLMYLALEEIIQLEHAARTFLDRAVGLFVIAGIFGAALLWQL